MGRRGGQRRESEGLRHTEEGGRGEIARIRYADSLNSVKFYFW